jgi:hypothetical protein
VRGTGGDDEDKSGPWEKGSRARGRRRPAAGNLEPELGRKKKGKWKKRKERGVCFAGLNFGVRPCTDSLFYCTGYSEEPQLTKL